MKITTRHFLKLSATAGLGLCAGRVSAQTAGLTVIGDANRSRIIPISVSGFTGEAYAVIKFDLEVAGFRDVTPDAAQFLVTGSNTDQLQGSVVERVSRAVIYTRGFSSAPMRLLAHTFSDDVVLKLTGTPGIARTRIAYKSNHGRSSEIHVSDYDGHNPVPVTGDGVIVAAPAWGAGNRMLYYTSYKNGNPDIFSHDLTTGARAAASRYPGLNTSAAISRDGRSMAMVLSKGGSPEIYAADVDGRNLRALTNTRWGAATPVWSPDGQTICYAGRESEAGSPRLYTVSAFGGTPRRLQTTGATSCTEPDWSPDGKTIVFTSQSGGFRICTVPAGGGEATVLADGEHPSWAPNSRTVIFAKRRSDQSYYLSLLDVPTKQVKDASRISGNCSQPAWAR